MSGWRRLAVIGGAWAAPLAWLALALASGPSDGTVVSSPTAWFGEARWGADVTVLRVYGDSPLQEGDRVLGIAGHSPSEWLTGLDRPERAVGDVITYEVRRPAANLDRQLSLEVELATYPVRAALLDNLPAVLSALGALMAGSFVFWRRPGDRASAALLGCAAAVAAAGTSYPLGVGASDLATSGGLWPHVGGEIAGLAALGALLLFALSFPSPASWRYAAPVALGVPVAAGATWWLLVVRPRSGPEQTRASLSLLLPGLIAVLPVVALLGVLAFRRSGTREDRVALRLVALALGTAAVVRVVLSDLPRLVGDRALVPGDLLTLLLVPPVLVALVAAVIRYRLNEIDGLLRRSLVQLVVATIVASVFLAAAGAVDLAADTSYESMLAGGAVALVLLPVALTLRRVATTLVFGDRDLPERVVSDLRRLDLRTAPEDALHGMLAVLGRRLRLSFASVEVYGDLPGDHIETSIGEARGLPTSIMIEASGAPLGLLLLEVDEDRDPFGARDRRLLEDVGSQVGTLVQAVTINRELQRSREALVAAREEERRRVRRDLHDGLGPSLASLAMKLEVAHDLIPQDPDGAVQLIGQLADQTRAEIGEVRRLVDGLRPPTLDQLGLASALRHQADEHNAAAGPGRMRWVLHSDDRVDPLPAAVEVAAYRVVVEAVNNAMRHSDARRCEVTLARRADTLEVEIVDDGHGFGPEDSPGVGLGSMRERAEELGGSCLVESTPDQGTRILVQLPLVARG